VSPIVLEDGEGRAVIAPHGAELRAWSVRDTPLIWEPDPAIWPDTAPILFPVVGWTRDGIVVDGIRYPLGLHGFAREKTFDVVEQWPSHCRLRLESDAATRALYPFDWSLEVAYAIAGAELEVRLAVENRGRGAMPYACGLHPGFRWPFAGGEMDDYAIVFDKREPARVPIITPGGLFTHETRRVPIDGRKLPLTAALMETEALCFLEPRDRRIRFAHTSGAAIDVALAGFPFAALWSRPAGHFLSIEAWTGHGDFVDADGDLFVKPAMHHLPPGATRAHVAKFSFAHPHVLLR
jgi:galactose mutarotase-like enzyme